MNRGEQDWICNRYVRLCAITSVALALLFPAGMGLAQAQTLTVLHNFTGADGNEPYAGVTFDQQGRIYGTTYYGGSNQQGAVYRLVHEGEGWIGTPIYSFGPPQSGDGSMPLARVVFGPGGLLYGTTSRGGSAGNGTVFSLQPPATACKIAVCPWVETALYDFPDLTTGVNPGYGDLVFDQAGNIYGTAFNSVTGGGVVFKLTRPGSGWTESVLWMFSRGSDGAGPASGVIFDNAGNLYGTTSEGGANGLGTVYELSPTQSGWTETTLYSFTANDNGVGSGSLVMDAHGDLFGITGLYEPGAAYELTSQNGTWSYQRLQSFSGMAGQGDGPVAPPTLDSQGNLYGPLPYDGSDQAGEIFKLTRSGNQWTYTPFYQFDNCTNGCEPYGAVIFDANGNMYGTTAAGGTRNKGVVWEITP